MLCLSLVFPTDSNGNLKKKKNSVPHIQSSIQVWKLNSLFDLILYFIDLIFSDECDVLDFSLNNSNVNSISLWFLPMLLSSAVNSSRLCWHRSCEISIQAMMVCLPLKSSLSIVASPYPPFLFQAEKKLL